MSRPDDVTRAFLRFLYVNPRFRPSIDGFLRGADATVDGVVVTGDELHRVLTRLLGHNLVATSGTVVDGLPERVGLTGAGLICAGQFDGDVRAWQEHASMRVTVLDSAGALGPPVLGPAPPAVRIPVPRTEPPTAGLARVARVLLLTLPSVRRDQEQCAPLRTLAERLLATIEAGGPTSEIRTRANRFRIELVSGPVAETLGVVLVDGLDEAIAEWERPCPALTPVPSPTTPAHAVLRTPDRAANRPPDGSSA
ncbi:hypothetical protein GIY23_11560 [Allosaccharopolyspora coralli]|uniref:Uncharacterized protein n=1 Tax=Allosaccharopolyspora coralli TaxID=2665642 RepID=A0A5Q3QEY4_9PSEU|nr:hypothetical protein [Allosaccharopolyspora coralli]QGK70075.1 hypothetical protein GIY23_11560 [Allosaccharopolyspora coralli]